MLFEDTVEESDELEYNGVCAAVWADRLFEIKCYGWVESYVVLFACWLLLRHYRGP